MPTVSQNLLQYTTNAMAAYGSNNAASGTMPAGWAAVKVDAFNPSTTGFAGQLMTDGQGHYRIAIRGTDTLNPGNPLNDASLDLALTTGKWHPQMDDAIRFVGEAIKQIGLVEKIDSLDLIRTRLDGSGHSAGGGLWELSAKFYGLRGINIDGPGVGQQVQNQRFAQLKVEQRSNGLADLQDNYVLEAGTVQRRIYTAVGEAGQNTPGVEIFVSPALQARDDALTNVYGAGVEVGSAGLGIIFGQFLTQHRLAKIAKLEGFGDAMQTQATLFVQQNLAQGLSASGYAEGSHQYEALGGSGMAFFVTVYRNDAGQLVEVRVPGKWEGGSFQALGAPISSLADANGKVHPLGVSDPVDSTPEVLITASRITPPTGLNTTRNSASFITDTNANDHLAVINAGGTLSDLWVLQKNAANSFANAQDFYKAVLASNPGITDVNKIAAGTSIYLPERLSDGTVSYHYAGGTSINSNPTTGEYHMVVQNPDGGQTVYSRSADEFGYTVKQISTDRAGVETLNYTGYQETLQSDIQAMEASWQTTAQSGYSSFDEGMRTDVVTDKATHISTLSVVDEASSAKQSASLPSANTSAQGYQNLLYSDMAGFVGALRGKDKVGQALYGSKMALDVMLSQGQSVTQSLGQLRGQLRSGLDAVSGAVGQPGNAPMCTPKHPSKRCCAATALTRI